MAELERVEDMVKSAESASAYRTYFDALDAAGNEEQKRQAFIAFAAAVFQDNRLATELALGAEYKVRFERSGIIRRGAVDAFYGNLVIEFENDLATTHDHALDQLKNYVAGAWTDDGHNERAYLAIATDGARWIVMAAVPLTVGEDLSTENVDLVPVTDFHFAELNQAAEFRNFLNRLFYRDFALRATSTNIARDFGTESPSFHSLVSVLRRKAHELKEDSQYETLKRQWATSLFVAYGSPYADDELFAIHTYLATLARLLVWGATEQREPTVADVEAVLNGNYFVSLGVENLWEDDFFKWPSIDSDTEMTGAWVALANQFQAYDMTTINEDVLKPLYEELVDPVTRHRLGEYYTPDWLAERVTQHALSTWNWSKGPPRVLDPTCGSGSFLRAVIVELRRAHNDVDLDSILESVTGFEVHPLAVIVARATYALTIRDMIDTATTMVSIPVYLADSFSLPEIERQQSIFEEDALALVIGDVTFKMPVEFVLHADLFDSCMSTVVEVGKAYGAMEAADPADVRSSVLSQISNRISTGEISNHACECLVLLALHLVELVRRREDSFYGFVVKNAHRPSILRNYFDYVVGNPPWLTVGDVESSEYKSRLVDFCAETDLVGRAHGDQAHTELSTLFLGHVCRTFLRDQPDLADEVRVAFVMPRSIFVATHHRYLREGTYAHRLMMDVRELWDLRGVEPLFRVPSCVVFAAKANARPTKIKTGRRFTGTLPAKDVSLTIAAPALTEDGVRYELAYLGKRSAWREVDQSRPLPTQRLPRPSSNAYVSRFRQGAILYPQTLFVVESSSKIDRGLPVRVKTDPAAVITAKKLADVCVDRVVDGATLFHTAATEHLLPFALTDKLWTVILPVGTDPSDATFCTLDVDELRRRGRLKTAAWLKWAEQHWEKARKEDDDSLLYTRLDTYGHLSSQAGRSGYMVLYNASGGRAVACYFHPDSFDLPFVVRDNTYWCCVETDEEAAYLTAFLNSGFVSDFILDWMTLGLLGPRHIHKRVLDVPWPPFDATDGDHLALAEIGKALSAAAAAGVQALRDEPVGRQRRALREALPDAFLVTVELLVAKIANSV